MAEPITIDEIISTLAALSAPDAGDGATTQEIAVARGCTVLAARRMIQAGIAAGSVVATRKRIVGMDGVVRLVPSYKVVKTAGKKK